MANATLNKALDLLFGDEGGYSNRTTDAGGPTKYGITMPTLAAYLGRPVQIGDIKNLSLDTATAIYLKGFWSQCGGDVLPAGLDYAVFDFTVNSGVSRAVKTLQEVLGVKQDGVVGVQTLDAIRKYGVRDLIEDYCDARMKFLRAIKGPKGFSANGRGWTIRVTGVDPEGKWKSQSGVVGNALALAGAPATIAVPTPVQTDPVPTQMPPATSPPWLDDVKTSALPPVADQASAKATPPAANPLAKPEVIGGLVTTATGLLTALATLQGPLAWAAAAVMVGGAAFAGVYFWSRVRKAEA